MILQKESPWTMKVQRAGLLLEVLNDPEECHMHLVEDQLRNDWTLLKCSVSKSFELPFHLKVCLWLLSLSLSLYVEIYAACDWTFSRLWAPSLLCRYRSAGGELGRAPCHTDERLCPTGQSVSRKILKVLDLIGSPSGYFRYDKPGLVNDQFERKAKLALNPLVWSFLRSTHGIQKVLFHCLVFLKKQPILF